MDRPDHTKIEYASSGAARPIDTRILVEEVPGGIRYTDPPGSGSAAHYRLLARTIFVVSAVLLVAIPLLAVSTSNSAGQYVGILVVSLIFAMTGKQFLEASRKFAVRPVIMEVGRLGLALNHPVAGPQYWPADQVTSIGYFAWLNVPGLAPDSFGGLVIRAGGKAYQVLHGRSIAEINWLAEQLRHGLGMSSASEKVPSASPPKE